MTCPSFNYKDFYYIRVFDKFYLQEHYLMAVLNVLIVNIFIHLFYREKKEINVFLI